MTRTRSLDDVAADYRGALRAADAGRLTEFDLTPYDRTGVPVRATVWDSADGGDAHGVGYGAEPPTAAVGALGEVAERVLMTAAIRALPVRSGSFRDLVGALGDRHVADPVALIPEAGTGYHPDRPLDWLPTVRWRTGETVWVPAEFACSDHGTLPPAARARPLLATPITNGLGAGDTLERAVGHGLLELVQRDGDNVSFRALDQGVVVDLSTAMTDLTSQVLTTLQSAGIEPVVKLASTEFACVVYCIGRDADPEVPPMALSAIGEAAHPDRDVAVVKALLEFASSRARRAFAFGPLETVRRLSPDYLAAELARPLGPQEPRALAAMREWAEWDADRMRGAVEPMFVHRDTVALDELPTQRVGGPADLLATLLDRLADFDVLVVPAGEDGSMRAAKVLAPGLEVETMSYLRIGERAARQLLARGSELVGPGAPGSPDQLPVPLTGAAEQRLGGPVWIDRAAVARTVGPLYPLYREPRRHAVQRLAPGGWS